MENKFALQNLSGLRLAITIDRRHKNLRFAIAIGRIALHHSIVAKKTYAQIIMRCGNQICLIKLIGSETYDCNESKTKELAISILYA